MYISEDKLYSVRWSLKGGGPETVWQEPPGDIQKKKGSRPTVSQGFRENGKYYRIFLSFHELDMERFLITYLDEMQVISNPFPDVSRHAAVVEAGLISWYGFCSDRKAYARVSGFTCIR